MRDEVSREPAAVPALRRSLSLDGARHLRRGRCERAGVEPLAKGGRRGGERRHDAPLDQAALPSALRSPVIPKRLRLPLCSTRPCVAHCDERARTPLPPKSTSMRRPSLSTQVATEPSISQRCVHSGEEDRSARLAARRTRAHDARRSHRARLRLRDAMVKELIIWRGSQYSTKVIAALHTKGYGRRPTTVCAARRTGWRSGRSCCRRRTPSRCSAGTTRSSAARTTSRRFLDKQLPSARRSTRPRRRRGAPLEEAAAALYWTNGWLSTIDTVGFEFCRAAPAQRCLQRRWRQVRDVCAFHLAAEDVWSCDACRHPEGFPQLLHRRGEETPDWHRRGSPTSATRRRCSRRRGNCCACSTTRWWRRRRRTAAARRRRRRPTSRCTACWSAGSATR